MSTRAKEFNPVIGRLHFNRGAALGTTLLLCATLLSSTAAYADGDGGNKIRTFEGSCDTQFAFTGPTTISLTGTCHLKHLGRTTMAATQAVTPRDDGTQFVTNSVTYTTAKGEKLYAHFMGLGVPTATGFSFSGTESYRGGTGRLADAMGNSALFGTATFTGPGVGVGEFTTQGSISY